MKGPARTVAPPASLVRGFGGAMVPDERTDMTTQHTPEPWSVRGLDGWAPSVFGPALTLVALCGKNDQTLTHDEASANAERIATCVNGCAGIPDPETTIPELVEALREIRDLAHKSYLWQAQDKARAVLAKLDKEGGPQS